MMNCRPWWQVPWPRPYCRSSRLWRKEEVRNKSGNNGSELASLRAKAKIGITGTTQNDRPGTRHKRSRKCRAAWVRTPNNEIEEQQQSEERGGVRVQEKEFPSLLQRAKGKTCYNWKGVAARLLENMVGNVTCWFSHWDGEIHWW